MRINYNMVSKCIVVDENPLVFGHVSTMLKSLYYNNSLYNNTVIWIGFHLGSYENIRLLYPSHRLIIFQMEQLFDGSPYDNECYIDTLGKADIVWDYDDANISWLRHKYGIDCIKHDLIQVPELVDIPVRNVSDHDIDILVYGHASNRRMSIINRLTYILNNRSIVYVSNIYGNALKDMISRSKIILNIHYYDNGSRQEQVRMFYLVANKKCVVSEPSDINYMSGQIHESDDSSPESIARTIESLLISNAWIKNN